MSDDAKKQCAFDAYDRDNLPCWGLVLTTDVVATSDGHIFVSTCMGHRLMFSNGPYVVEPKGDPK